MGLVSSDDGWRLPDWLLERIAALLPARPSHPLGCHNGRVSDRDAMAAILLVLRTGMQWNALNATGDLFVVVGAAESSLPSTTRGSSTTLPTSPTRTRGRIDACAPE